ncbi:MAG: ATP-binding protein [Dehalococcoidia bacterium]|nr:ATP-binding protein [Dehalococcoidia bacterium]
MSEWLERPRQMSAGCVVVDFAADLPLVSADPNRLERILMNLVTNAIKYSPPDREVVVGAKSTEEGAPVFVADRGSGVAPEDLPYIFDRIHSAKGLERAEGLGLSS